MSVEDVAAQCDCVFGQLAVPWPRCGHLALAVDETHAGQSMAAEPDRVDVEQGQFADRPRCQRIAARLVARERSLLDDSDVMAGSRQPRGDRCSGRTTADDEDVGVQDACRQPAEGGEPGMASGPIGMIPASPIAGASGEVKS